MSLSEQQNRSDLHRRRSDRGLHGYGSVVDEPFAPSLLNPRGPEPYLAGGWAWFTLAMAVLGCVANRATDRDIDSALSNLQPTVSILAGLSAVVGVALVWRSAAAQRVVLVRDRADADEFFRQRTQLLDLQLPSQLSKREAEARLAQTREERKELTVMARQVNTVMFVVALIIVVSTSAVISMAWAMGEPLPLVLSWLEALVLVALVLTVLPTFDRRYTLNLAASAAIRKNDADVQSWMKYGRPTPNPDPHPTLTKLIDEVRSPSTALAIAWLVALTLTLLVRSL